MQIPLLKISCFTRNKLFSTQSVNWGYALAFSLISSVCFPQSVANLQFNHFSAEHGLSQTVFNTIFQDRKGYMWFGSYTGLLKFDGYKFISFTPGANKKNSIADNSIIKICGDSAGNIWMLHDTYPALTKYNPQSESFTLYPYSNSNRTTGIPGYISDLITDRQGKVWIGTDAGLCFYDAASDKMINLSEIIYPDTLINRNIHCLMIDHKGLVWIATGAGINIYDPVQKKLSLFNPSDKQYAAISKQVQFIMEDHSGNIWMGLSWGNALNQAVYRHNSSTGESKVYGYSATDPHSLGSNYVNRLMEDSYHTVWVCMYGGGLNAYQPATDNFIRFKADNADRYALNSNQVMSLLEDRGGVFWIGTNGGGLNSCYLTKEKFSVYQNYDKDFISHYPLSLYKDARGRIYMTTLGAGIYEFNPVTGNFRSFKITSPESELAAFNSSYDLLEASDGNLWAVSFDEGLHKLDRQTGRFTTVHSVKDNADATFHNLSNCIVEDLDKRLWIGTIYGLKCYNLQTKTFSGFEKLFPDTNRLSSDVIDDLYCDPEGILWISGTNGLTLFNTKTAQIKIFKHDDNNPHSISSNRINYFYDDHKGKVWIGTEGGGLNEFDKKNEQFISYTTEIGLPDNSIYGILDDEHGNLWLTTNKGLCKFTPPSGTNGKPLCRNYDMSDGLPGNEFNYKTCVKGDDGKLYFASTKGLVAFNPEELKDNPFIPPVVITEFSVSNRLVLLNDSTGILKLPVDETKEIILSYEQNDFSFTFSALSYVHPEKNQYSYKLDNYDKEWVYTDASKRFANYTNLDPGEYTFKVKASNNDGVWNETPVTIKIVITPPWWRTWWFKVLCFFVAGLILFGIYNYRMQKVKDIRRIRNKIASDLHDDLGATLSSISIMSELVNQQIKDKVPQATTILEKIGSSSRNMIESVNDMVWAINPQNDSFENIIKRMRTFASEILSAKDIAFHFDFDKNLLQSKLKMDMRRNFYLVFKEAVNNLAKYSGAANAFVMIWNRENNLKMTIRDDGEGFDPVRVAGGNGLKNMQQRADMMKAVFRLESVPGKGTIIELEFKNM